MSKKAKLKKNSAPPLKNTFHFLYKASGLGFVIALPPVLLAFLGLILDRTLNTKPILTIGFIFFGTMIGFTSALKETNKLVKKK